MVKIKRIWLRFLLWCRKNKQTPKDEALVKAMTSKFLSKETVDKKISPLSDEYILIDKEQEIFICVGNGYVNISNHGFLYMKVFTLSFCDELKKIIRQSIENERQRLKKELFKNETDFLQNILNRV